MAPTELPPSDEFTPEEFNLLLRLARKALRADRATRDRLQKSNVNITPANFYSNIPLVDDIENSFEFGVADGPYHSPAVFDSVHMLAFLQQLDVYAEEFDPPREGDVQAPTSFFWANPAFSFSDAMAYYCVLRYMKPARVVEVGSGYSTLVALQALAKNGAGSLLCVEPFPMRWLAAMSDRLTLHTVPVQTLNAAFFNERLGDGDVLFIDSTHTVKAGSDCLHLYLRVLPEISSDIMVHAHDIYLPFPMPKKDFERHIYWTEQYLLYAFLLDNPRARVAYGSRYSHRFHDVALKRFMRDRWPGGGASFWFHLGGKGGASRRS